MTYMNTQKGNTVWWVIGIVAVAVAAFFMFRKPRADVTVPPAGQVNGANQQQIIVEGEVTCLPHRDTSGPTTMECAYGLKADDGSYYGLNAATLPPNEPVEYDVGDRISVKGVLLPPADVPGNFWQIYNITGYIQMETYWKFTEK